MGLHEQFSQEHAWRSGPGIPGGSDIEQAVLGIAAIPLKERRDEYMPFAMALEYVKEHQPNTLKRSRIIQNLRIRVADLCDDIESPVKFFTAVGTPLDTYHGVDGFFLRNDRIATVDLSLQDKSEHKADVLIKAAFDKEGRPEISTQEINRVTNEIAQRLNQRRMRKAA